MTHDNPIDLLDEAEAPPVPQEIRRIAELAGQTNYFNGGIQHMMANRAKLVLMDVGWTVDDGGHWTTSESFDAKCSDHFEDLTADRQALGNPHPMMAVEEDHSLIDACWLYAWAVDKGLWRPDYRSRFA